MQRRHLMLAAASAGLLAATIAHSKANEDAPTLQDKGYLTHGDLRMYCEVHARVISRWC